MVHNQSIKKGGGRKTFKWLYILETQRIVAFYEQTPSSLLPEKLPKLMDWTKQHKTVVINLWSADPFGRGDVISERVCEAWKKCYNLNLELSLGDPWPQKAFKGRGEEEVQNHSSVPFQHVLICIMLGKEPVFFLY